MNKLILATLAVLAIVPATAMAQPGAPAHGAQRGHQQDSRAAPGPQRGYQQDSRNARPDIHQAARDYNRTNPWRAAPFRYQRFTAGARIQPSYFGSQYFIRDYQRFHWSRPGANQRWIRHYDDALLVNTRTGRVVKVIYNAFR